MVTAKDTAKKDEDNAVELSRKISDFVLFLAKKKGMSQGAVADAMGYSRSSFCQMLNSKDASRLWRLPTLCGVCRVLGISLEKLIESAQKWEPGQNNMSAALCFIADLTEPRSMKRLKSLIEYNSPENLHPQMRLFEIGCKLFVSDYLSGKLSDEEAYRLIEQAEAERKTEKKDPLPLWAQLAEMYEDQKP